MEEYILLARSLRENESNILLAARLQESLQEVQETHGLLSSIEPDFSEDANGDLLIVVTDLEEGEEEDLLWAFYNAGEVDLFEVEDI